ncbi:MAG: hypothetical protein ABIR77_07425 [Sphingomicrobium sp.]
MILLAAVPLLYPPVPPLVDLLGHMGRYRVELDLAKSSDLQRYWDFKWALIGNLGVDLLIIPFAKVFGLELGVKLIVLAIPPMTVAGFLWVAREVHLRIPPTALFALPFAYGHPFLFGFVNFSLSMALAFLAFGLWLRLARLGRLRLRAALFIPISLMIFITHAFGWGVLGLLCYSAEAVRQHDRGRTWWSAGLHAATHAAALGLPLVLMLLWRSETGIQGGTTFDWFNLQAKLYWLVTALRDRWRLFDILSVTVPLVVLVFVLIHDNLGFSRNLAFSTVVLVVGFMLLPRVIFGSAYADMRLMPFILAVTLLAVRFRTQTELPTARLLASVALAFIIVRTAGTTLSLGIAANHQRVQFQALNHVARGTRVLSLAGQPCIVRVARWTLARNSHLGSMAIVRRDAFENSQWEISGANLLRVKNPGNYRGFSADPSQFVVPEGCGGAGKSLDSVLATLPRDAFDYLWLIDPPAYDRRLVAGMQLVWSKGGDALYRIHP